MGHMERDGCGEGAPEPDVPLATMSLTKNGTPAGGFTRAARYNPHGEPAATRPKSRRPEIAPGPTLTGHKQGRRMSRPAGVAWGR